MNLVPGGTPCADSGRATRRTAGKGSRDFRIEPAFRLRHAYVKIKNTNTRRRTLGLQRIKPCQNREEWTVHVSYTTPGETISWDWAPDEGHVSRHKSARRLLWHLRS